MSWVSLFTISKVKKGTVWKLRIFPATQILREIDFEGCGSSKIVIFAVSEALNLVFCQF